MALRKPIKPVAPVRKLGKPVPIKAKPSSAFDAIPKHAVSKGGAFDRVKTEKKKAELNAAKPWNVIVPIGDSLTVYILDDGEPFATYQHIIGGSRNQRGRDVPCIQDGPEPCPVCLSEGKQGFFVMYLTAVIPKEEYTKKGEQVPTVRHYQKKLLQIKLKMAETWRRIYEEHGTFRGLVLKLNRDNKLDPSSGNQVTVLRKLSEAQIKTYAKALEIKDKDARDYIIKSEIDKPFDYAKIFPAVNAETLAKIAGVGTGTGGLRTLGSEDLEDDATEAGSEWGE